jgi:hypothetical protein
MLDILFLKGVHPLMIASGTVVIPNQVENTMDDKSHQLIAKRNANFLCLPTSCVNTYVHFAFNWIGTKRKTENVGCPVMPKIAHVEGMDERVITKNNTNARSRDTFTFQHYQCSTLEEPAG